MYILKTMIFKNFVSKQELKFYKCEIRAHCHLVVSSGIAILLPQEVEHRTALYVCAMKYGHS